jgi:hypothetical protein
MLGRMAGQGGHARRSRPVALGAALLLALSLPALSLPGGGALGGSALAAPGKAAVPRAASPGTQTAQPEGSNGSAFSELSQGGGQETSTETTTGKTTPTEAHNSKKTVIVIVVAALALLVAVGYVIVRDARKNAPATDPQVAEARSAHDAAAMLRKRRAKAKAARQARKRNR